MSEHLSGGDVERFLRGGLPGSRQQEVLRHLLRGCTTCREMIRPLLVPSEAPHSDSGRRYEAPMAHALAAVMSRLPEARGVDQRLVAKAVDLMRASPRGIAGLPEEELNEIGSRALLHALLRRSFDERYRNPREMVRIALFAQIVAQNLDPQEHPPEVIADEQALAWGELGNAYRVNDELSAADAALGRAEDCLNRGTGNLLLLARLAELQASLWNDQRLLPDACEMLDKVSQLYQKIGDDHLAGRALVKRGIYTNYEGEPRLALRYLQQGLALLDRERDPQLVVSATESLLWILVECGEYRTAGEMLLESGLRDALTGQPLSLIKLRWLEGQVFIGLGKPGRAEAALCQARAEFKVLNQGYYAALVGLDLAAVWLGQGKMDEVLELAEDMLATFQKLGIQREALRAMDYLRRACREREATPHTARQVSQFLKRLEHEPQLRFRR